MARLTYVAKRELETTGYLKTGTDISAAPADDSFNAAGPTVLSGLLADQWVQTSGFANAANNGYFQAQANATSGKILQITPPVTRLRLPGVSGNYASTPDSAGNSVTGNIELMARASLTDWTPAVANVFIAKDDGSTNRDYSLATDAGSTGKLVFFYTSDGSTTAGRVATSTVAVAFADLAVGWVKATYNTGTGVVQFFTSIDGVAFTQLGTNVILTAGAIHNGTTALFVGRDGSGPTNPLNGRLYYAEVRNGIGGPIVAAFDASRGLRNGTTIVAATGETWTINTSGTPPAALQGAALVTEAAGPVVTLTGYKRGFGQSYSIEFKVEQADRTDNAIINSQQPLGPYGPEVLNFRNEIFVDVLTEILDETTQVPQFREFLASVQAGEQFTFDRYGTIASPVDPRVAVRSNNGYKEQRVMTSMRQRIPFQVRLLS